jgi:hypothetical protein
LLRQRFNRFIFFYFRFRKRGVDQVYFRCFLRDKLSIPADKKIVSVKVRPADLSSHWDITFFGENDAVDQMGKVVLRSSVFESASHIELRKAEHFPNIGRVKAGITSDDDLPFNMLPSRLEIKVVKNRAI